MCRAKTFRCLLAFALLTRFSNSTLVNQTIDDGLGVQYLPTTNDSDELVWKSQDTCGDTCPVNPDSTEAHNNTWSSATCIGSETVSATFAFHGTAIYIYFIVSRYTLPSGAIAAANCEFWVDGQVVGSFVQIPLPDVIEYNTLVYANNSLSDALHTFSIRARSDSFLILTMHNIRLTLRSLFHWVPNPRCLGLPVAPALPALPALPVRAASQARAASPARVASPTRAASSTPWA
ncbi:hypothetical protein BD779DRAFT_107163 [Infundibulicybe gibba]|nr:hypothetical protein BD779DRAFT_107163 [Infundibulicybe gibba]